MIAPWNFALCVLTWKIAAALLVGEGVVFEPGRRPQERALALAEALYTAGPPAGALKRPTGRRS